MEHFYHCKSLWINHDYERTLVYVCVCVCASSVHVCLPICVLPTQPCISTHSLTPGASKTEAWSGPLNVPYWRKRYLSPLYSDAGLWGGGVSIKTNTKDTFCLSTGRSGVRLCCVVITLTPPPAPTPINPSSSTGAVTSTKESSLNERLGQSRRKTNGWRQRPKSMQQDYSNWTPDVSLLHPKDPSSLSASSIVKFPATPAVANCFTLIPPSSSC